MAGLDGDDDIEVGSDYPYEVENRKLTDKKPAKPDEANHKELV